MLQGPLRKTPTRIIMTPRMENKKAANKDKATHQFGNTTEGMIETDSGNHHITDGCVFEAKSNITVRRNQGRAVGLSSSQSHVFVALVLVVSLFLLSCDSGNDYPLPLASRRLWWRHDRMMERSNIRVIEAIIQNSRSTWSSEYKIQCKYTLPVDTTVDTPESKYTA